MGVETKIKHCEDEAGACFFITKSDKSLWFKIMKTYASKVAA